MQLPRGETSSSPWSAGKLIDLHAGEDSAYQMSEPPTRDLTDSNDFESLYHTYSNMVPPHKMLIVQSLQRLSETAKLFYTDVTTDNGHVLRALVDSGSI